MHLEYSSRGRYAVVGTGGGRLRDGLAASRVNVLLRLSCIHARPERRDSCALS